MTDIEFLLEKNKWIFTDSIHDAEVIPYDYNNILDKYKELEITEDQILLLWYAEFHGDHITSQSLREQIKPIMNFHKKTIVVHTNGLDIADPQYIHCDIMFNRQKLYCTDYQEELCLYKQWTNGIPKITFELADINKTLLHTNKIFLFPNRIYDGNNANNVRNDLKIKFLNFMHSINANMYFSDPLNDIVLEPNGSRKPLQVNMKTGGSWYPIDNYYYNSSYISVCTETVLENSSVCYPSEKYFDPLIKGNFPLIFSAPGTIENLKTLYGFKFPDWIDYSYDLIYNFDSRVEAYFNSIEKVSKMSLTELHGLYLRDKHILDHNKNVFFNKTYSLLYDKILKSKQQMNW